MSPWWKFLMKKNRESKSANLCGYYTVIVFRIHSIIYLFYDRLIILTHLQRQYSMRGIGDTRRWNWTSKRQVQSQPIFMILETFLLKYDITAQVSKSDFCYSFRHVRQICFADFVNNRHPFLSMCICLCVFLYVNLVRFSILPDC